MSNKMRIAFAAVALGIALTAAPARALPAPDLVKLVNPMSVVSGLWSRLVSLLSPSQVTIDPNGAASDGGVFIDPNGGLRDSNVTIDPNGAWGNSNVTIDPNGALRDSNVTIDPNGGLRDSNVTIDPNGGR